ncbi:MAG: DUF507 family protein [Nitrospirae bacterium YQR-1]
MKTRKLVKLIAGEPEIRKRIKTIITAHLNVCEEVDTIVRKKLKSMKKGLIEGTQEWDILYRKFFDEEGAKRGGI